MFSDRVPADRRPNAFARAIAAARAGSAPLLDLTVSNPTRVGIRYGDALLAPLGTAAALTYEPMPLGWPAAREAVARDYRRRGIDLAPERIVLTASTSDAYSLLFKLLCDPGCADVLAPVPSYPLFDHLTALDGVRPRPYRLEYHGRWSVDAADVDRAWTRDTRAILAVSPNNPTGSVLDEADAAALATRAAVRGAALILDEVFCDYPLHEPWPEPEALRHPPCLLFRLGGLSKSAGLPQVKLGWIAVDGPDALVAEALDRLELICDTYLSVSTPVQLAAPALMAGAATVRTQILERVRANDRTLTDLLSRHPPVTRLHADGGWSAVLRVPATTGEEALVMRLLERDRVIVHPGFFFDFPNEAFLVLSLLPEPGTFARGVTRVLERADAA